MPVGDVALYSTTIRKDTANFLKIFIYLYWPFQEIVVLWECVIAQVCEEQKSLLHNQRWKKILKQDMDISTRRMEENLHPNSLEEFHDAIRLLPCRVMCNAYSGWRIVEEEFRLFEFAISRLHHRPKLLNMYEPLVIGKGVNIMSEIGTSTEP